MRNPPTGTPRAVAVSGPAANASSQPLTASMPAPTRTTAARGIHSRSQVAPATEPSIQNITEVAARLSSDKKTMKDAMAENAEDITTPASTMRNGVRPPCAWATK